MKRLVFGFVVLLFLLGCTEAPVNVFVPADLIQFVNNSTDLNYTAFSLGVYDGNCLRVDNNIISVTDCNGFVAGSVSWPDITDFPVGCDANQAVQIIGAVLTCIDVNVGGSSGGLSGCGILLML